MVSEVCQCLERKTRKGKIGGERKRKKTAEEGRKAAEQKMKLINGK